MNRSIARLAAYLWASPNTAIGAVAGLLAIALGGRGRIVRGAAEIGGGPLARLRGAAGIDAVTLGHVILAPGRPELERSRAHEQVHVRQYERWGPFFLPAYAASSAWQFLRGGDPYLDNVFEREARATEALAAGGSGGDGDR